MPDKLDRTSGLALIDSVLETITEHLEDERHRVNEEIRNYPAPIPACDAQFNYLLEERVRIAQELAGLKALVRESLTEQAHVKYIEEFVSSGQPLLE